MKIKLQAVKIKDLTENYQDNNENGVVGFNGLLDIRPAYQREFVYKAKQREAVIDTVIKGFPLNSMYWIKNSNGYELLDGQQRTISICEYVKGAFSINFRFFHNLTQEEKDNILNYELMIYVCESDNEKEKLDWFETINIAGEKLTKQELRNAIYTGKWLYDAKKHFSKTQGAAYSLASKYVKGSPIRQDYLETALKWISNDNVESYMSENQHNQNANELWLYFQNVINWTKSLFTNYRKEIKGVNLGALYNEFKDNSFNTEELENEIAKLMGDDDVTKKAGIYNYVLTRNEKHLNIRAFSKNQKREKFEIQGGVCPHCKQTFEIDEMQCDHILPWSKGGKTNIDNLQLLCASCNRKKSNS